MKLVAKFPEVNSLPYTGPDSIAGVSGFLQANGIAVDTIVRTVDGVCVIKMKAFENALLVHPGMVLVVLPDTKDVLAMSADLVNTFFKNVE